MMFVFDKNSVSLYLATCDNPPPPKKKKKKKKEKEKKIPKWTFYSMHWSKIA